MTVCRVSWQSAGTPGEGEWACTCGMTFGHSITLAWAHTCKAAK